MSITSQSADTPLVLVGVPEDLQDGVPRLLHLPKRPEPLRCEEADTPVTWPLADVPAEALAKEEPELWPPTLTVLTEVPYGVFAVTVCASLFQGQNRPWAWDTDKSTTRIVRAAVFCLLAILAISKRDRLESSSCVSS